MKLMSMTEFILHIDWMTTKEFCEEYNIPLPKISDGASGFLVIDAIKHRFFVEYAKFLCQPITLGMFVGKDAMFPGFEVTKTFENQPSLQMVGSHQVYAYLEADAKESDRINMNYPRFTKCSIGDLVGYVEECNYKPK